VVKYYQSLASWGKGLPKNSWGQGPSGGDVARIFLNPKREMVQEKMVRLWLKREERSTGRGCNTVVKTRKGEGGEATRIRDIKGGMELSPCQKMGRSQRNVYHTK